jgi:hypothetical protein
MRDDKIVLIIFILVIILKLYYVFSTPSENKESYHRSEYEDMYIHEYESPGDLYDYYEYDY